jgi:hypothetical protein
LLAEAHAKNRAAVIQGLFIEGTDIKQLQLQTGFFDLGSDAVEQREELPEARLFVALEGTVLGGSESTLLPGGEVTLRGYIQDNDRVRSPTECLACMRTPEVSQYGLVEGIFDRHYQPIRYRSREFSDLELWLERIDEILRQPAPGSSQ